MKKYAQIDKNNICFATANLDDGTIVPDNWIAVDSETVIGKRYNNGVWEEVPQPEPEPTQLDRIETLLNTSYTDAQNAAVDAYTEELIEGGIL